MVSDPSKRRRSCVRWRNAWAWTRNSRCPAMKTPSTSSGERVGTVDHGANVLLVQTNNATFGFTAESVQQLAISRIRAIEHSRSIVHVSTVGVSALITPDGTAHRVSALFTAGVLAADLPLRSERTMADRLGALPEDLAVGGLVMMLVLLGRRRSRR